MSPVTHAPPPSPYYHIHAHVMENIISSFQNTHVSFCSVSRRVKGVKLTTEPDLSRVQTTHVICCFVWVAHENGKWFVTEGLWVGEWMRAYVHERGGWVNVIANLLMPPSNGLLQWKRCRVDNGTLVSLLPPLPLGHLEGGELLVWNTKTRVCSFLLKKTNDKNNIESYDLTQKHTHKSATASWVCAMDPHVTEREMLSKGETEHKSGTGVL